jgi:SEC-C motif-containing protein
MKTLCPCHSGKKYVECCKPYHEGLLPENALVLMRSRYSAYALNLAEYIIATTHPQNPFYTRDLETWKKDIANFSQGTQFENLEILDIHLGDTESWVTFKAILKQGKIDASFAEKSHFIKVQAKWLYRDGKKPSGG